MINKIFQIKKGDLAIGQLPVMIQVGRRFGITWYSLIDHVTDFGGKNFDKNLPLWAWFFSFQFHNNSECKWWQLQLFGLVIGYMYKLY